MSDYKNDYVGYRIERSNELFQMLKYWQNMNDGNQQLNRVLKYMLNEEK